AGTGDPFCGGPFQYLGGYVSAADVPNRRTGAGYRYQCDRPRRRGLWADRPGRGVGRCHGGVESADRIPENGGHCPMIHHTIFPSEWIFMDPHRPPERQIRDVSIGGVSMQVEVLKNGEARIL